jgi:hypothetical protein
LGSEQGMTDLLFSIDRAISLEWQRGKTWNNSDE